MKTFTRRMIALSMTAALGLSGAGLAFADNYKDETVYVLTGNAGSVNKIIVSDWLKNKDGDTSLVDASDLLDIQNVKGDEKFTLDGTVLCKIREGTQSGSRIRLKGKGIVSMKNPSVHGDLYVKVQIQVPTSVSPQARQKLREFEEAMKASSPYGNAGAA